MFITTKKFMKINIYKKMRVREKKREKKIFFGH